MSYSSTFEFEGGYLAQEALLFSLLCLERAMFITVLSKPLSCSDTESEETHQVFPISAGLLRYDMDEPLILPSPVKGAPSACLFILPRVGVF